MSLPNILFGRLRKLLRVQLGIKTAAVKPRTALGQAPIEFSDDFIARELRFHVNLWFNDLIPPFETVSWNHDTTMHDVVVQILDRTRVATIQDYRLHLMTLADAALTNAAGAEAQAVAVAERGRVRDAMNVELDAVLIHRITLPDLGRDQAVILSNILKRMLT
jgi:hypothetical protein